MKKNTLFPLIVILIYINVSAVYAKPAQTVEVLYKNHCAVCHGEDRLGLMGPALLSQNLKYIKKKKAIKIISDGKVATQMLGFKDKLSIDQITLLAEFILKPLDYVPQWTAENIKKSKKSLLTKTKLSNKPIFKADPLNLFIVVEVGDHHATLLDGDLFEPITRFTTHFAVHGGPKYSPDGRYVYFGSRDGWILKYDIYNLTKVAEVRAGINMRNIALSQNGKYLIAANYLPHNLVIFNADDLSLIKTIKAETTSGKSSRVSAVYTAPPRNSFVVAFKDIKEVWEINYSDVPPLGFGRWTHDYRIEAKLDKKRFFPIRRIETKYLLDDFFFDQDYISLIGTSRKGQGQIVDLDVGKVISEFDLDGMPHLASGITFKYKGSTVLATPNMRKAQVSVFDTNTWQHIKDIPTKGSGFFMRSHKNSKYAWVDVFFGKNRDLMHVIDKETLEVVKTLKPAPGKTSAHVEFTKNGDYAIVSIWDMDGAIVVYDAKTLEEVKRIPMKKPSGKYNVYNKINYAEGTSH